MGMGASQGVTHGRTLLLMSPARMPLRNSAGNSAASGFRRPADSVSVPLFQLAGRHNTFTSDVKLVPTVWPLPALRAHEKPDADGLMDRSADFGGGHRGFAIQSGPAQWTRTTKDGSDAVCMQPRAGR